MTDGSGGVSVSLIAWLDSSADEQRRVREIVAMFADKGTLDELGVGQIRDAFSDLLFPGTSTIQTRARYFLFVPWAFLAAAGSEPASTIHARANVAERRLIEGLRKAGAVEGLIGRQAGAKVKNLPSAIYWSGLTRFGILTHPVSAGQIGPLRHRDVDADELADRVIGDWAPTLPPAPKGFPWTVDDGFDLTLYEAGWLKERIMASVPDSMLAHLVAGPLIPDPASAGPWDDESVTSSSPRLRQLLEHARLFSLAVEGASLLYNFQVAERYEAAGHTDVADPVERYRVEFDDWSDEVLERVREFGTWDRADMWRAVRRASPQINLLTESFVNNWIDAVVDGRAFDATTSSALREQISTREQFKKGRLSRFINDRQVATWQGSSGSQRLNFRWPTVRTLVRDIHAGTSRAGS